MCIAVFMWQAHPLYPFLLLFNRDEYHSRLAFFFIFFPGFWHGFMSCFGDIICRLCWVLIDSFVAARPTKPLGWWEGAEILGGRDEKAGGTWLASTTDGKFAFLTNFREVQSIPQAKSRGELPVRFLQVILCPHNLFCFSEFYCYIWFVIV